jgi:hypothetical protein
MSNQALVLFSGYNERAIIAFCRWARFSKVSYHIIAKDQSDSIFLTEYKNKVVFTRTDQHLKAEQISSYCSKVLHRYGYQKIIILPSTEFLNRFLLKNRTIIESESCVIPLVDENLYRTISDKSSFVSLCKHYKLSVPEQFETVPSTPPFVAKPSKYLSSSGQQLVPKLIQTRVELDKFKKENSADYFYQEFVTGKSIYLLAYLSAKNTILYSQENLMQQANGGSVILAKQSNFHNSNEARAYVDMLRSEKYLGIIMIEIRFNESTKKYYMIEANPRVWGPLQLLVDNDSGILETMLKDYGFSIKEGKSTDKKDAYFYYWSGGISSKDTPITYHQYSPVEFLADFPRIKNHDVFSRKDTISLFLKELGSCNE